MVNEPGEKTIQRELKRAGDEVERAEKTKPVVTRTTPVARLVPATSGGRAMRPIVGL